MLSKINGTVLFAAAVMAFAFPSWADTPNPIKPEIKADAKASAQTETPGSTKVSLSAVDLKLRDVIDSLARQSGEKFIVESSVGGKVTLMLKDVSLDIALNSLVSSSGKMQWRKLYIPKDSKLIDQPDKFASTVRLLTGLSFPSMVMAGSSNGKMTAHFDDKSGVSAAEEAAIKTLGMVKVYLITNDAAVAAKAKSDEKKDAVNKYTKLQQDQIDAFMKMTPEQREQAIMTSLDMMDKIGPEYMGAAMDALSRTDPQVMQQKIARQSEMLLSMSTESRRAMLRMSIMSQQMISPELKQLLQDDAKAIMEEMQSGQNGQQ